MNSELRDLQLHELRLLKIFQRLCKDHGLRYFALGGTLLGAVRHKGFIPWDDDIDVGVPRPDYDRLCQILAVETLDANIRFCTYRNTQSYIRFFGRLENTDLRIVRHDKIKEEQTFAWIDIFPLDGMPNNSFFRKLKSFYVLVLRTLYRFSCFDQLVNVNKTGRPWHEKILIFIGLHTPIQKFFGTMTCLNWLEKTLTSTPYDKTDYFVNAMGAYKFKEMFHKKYYGEGRAYPFEDTLIQGPVDYDFVCKQLYGDYMTPPAEDKRNHHGLQKIASLTTEG